MTELPSYKSHKIVQAAPIAAMSDETNTTEPPFVTVMLNGEAQKIIVPANFFARGRPSQGDYVMIYRDGYMSWSPKREFEDGYTPT